MIDPRTSILIDLVRGISAQLVVIGHGISFFGIFTSFHYPNIPWMQNVAVTCFFILSGFVITSSIENTRYSESKLKRFLINRFARIYPAFVAALIFVFLIDYVRVNLFGFFYEHHVALNFKTFFGNILMLQDFPRFMGSQSNGFIITSFGSGRPFWTLAVEWWIYMFVGYLFLTDKEHRNKLIFFPIAFFLAIVPLEHLFGGRGTGLFGAWMLGAVAYHVYKENVLQHFGLIHNLGFAAFFLIQAIDAVLGTKGYDLYFAFYLTCTGVFVIEIIRRVQLPKPLGLFAVFLGSFSYSIYLIHYSIFEFSCLLPARQSCDASAMSAIDYDFRVLMFFLSFIISNLVAFGFAIIFERIIGRWLRRVLTQKFCSENKIKE